MLLSELRQAGADSDVFTALASRISLFLLHDTSPDSMEYVIALLSALRQAGADGDVITALAIQAAERIPLDKPTPVKLVLFMIGVIGVASVEAAPIIPRSAPGIHVASRVGTSARSAATRADSSIGRSH